MDPEHSHYTVAYATHIKVWKLMVENTIYDVSNLAFWDKFRVPLRNSHISCLARHESVFLFSCRRLRQLSAAGAATRRSVTTHPSSRACHLSIAGFVNLKYIGYIWIWIFGTSSYWIMLSRGKTWCINFYYLKFLIPELPDSNFGLSKCPSLYAKL